MANLGDDGFTLPEVVVAFAILSLSLAVLYQAQTTSARSANALEMHAAALELAENRLAGFGAETPPRAGEWSGQSENGQLEWRLEAFPNEGLLPEEGARPVLSAYDVSVTVSWHLGSAERELTLRTLKVATP